MCSEIDSEKIRQALVKNAQIVEKYGEAYLPTFLRLEKEYQKSLEKCDIHARVKKYLRP